MSRIQEGLKQLGVRGDSDQIGALERLMEEISRIGSRIHIVSRAVDVKEESLKQILDSAAVLRLRSLPQEARLVDVGSSIGFPGLVLAVLRPSWTVTLLDRSEKRIAWSRILALRLGLRNTMHVVGEFPSALQTIDYNILISKAFLPIDRWFDEAKDLLGPGNLIVGMTTPSQSPKEVTGGLEVVEEDSFVLPFFEAKRLNVLARRTT